METFKFENIGCKEISNSEAEQANGGVILAILAAFSAGYLLGRWIGGTINELF
ncbi:MAG: hypothetical protein QM786_00905 [Breznakibacter sp.]